MLVGCTLAGKMFHASNPIEVGLRVFLQSQFEKLECANIHSTDQITKHYTGFKMDIDYPLYYFLHYQVKIFLKSWAMGDSAGDTFSLEGSE